MHAVGESGANVPAFLAKLWKLVEDSALDDLISWNPSGLSFTIRDQARFAREILPLYYKHNNMASFVRQLNMYGFHKVVSLDSGGLKLDKDEMEFAHTYFIRGHEYLLEHIKRKIPISKQDESKVKPEMLTKVLSDVRTMRGKQESLDTRLAAMKKENEALWREVASLRQKHLKQQQIVNKLIQFLISVVQPSGRSGIGLKRKVLMLEGEAHTLAQSKNVRKGQRIVNINFAKAMDKGKASPIIANISPGGPTIHDVTDLIGEIGEEVSLDPEINEEPECVDDVQAAEVTDPATEIEFPSELLEAQPIIEILPDKPPEEQKAGLDIVQPDLSVVAQLEGNDDSAMLSSPLSPDLMLAVNPNEVVGKRSPLEHASALDSLVDVTAGSFATGKGKETKKTNGVATDKKPANENDMCLALVDHAGNLMGSRDELDNHLDNMQMDLENLREILSLQPGSVDPATLLGMMAIGSDDSWRDWLISCSSPPEINYPNPLDQQGVSKLFSAEEPTAFLNTFSDVHRPMSSASGHELMSYNPSLFELTTEDGQFLPDDSSLLVSDLTEDDTGARDEKADELFFDLLGVTEGPSPAKKTKSN